MAFFKVGNLVKQAPCRFLQEEGAASFAKSWNELMSVIETKGAALQKAG